MGCVVIFMPLPLYPQGKQPRYTFGRKLAGFHGWFGLYAEEKVLDPAMTRTSVRLSESLYWLQYALVRVCMCLLRQMKKFSQTRNGRGVRNLLTLICSGRLSSAGILYLL
jgi:hypothetical protein